MIFAFQNTQSLVYPTLWYRGDPKRPIVRFPPGHNPGYAPDYICPMRRGNYSQQPNNITTSTTLYGPKSVQSMVLILNGYVVHA